MTIFPEKYYATGASRMFKKGKEVDGFGHPTEEELARAILFRYH